MIRKVYIPVVIIAALILSFLYIWLYTPYFNDTTDEVVYWSVEGEYDDRVELEVARTPREHALGVSEWEEMYHVSDSPDKAQERGMLFEFEGLTVPSFWMKGVDFPLDIIWLKGNTIVDITERAQPQPGIPEEELELYLPATEVNRVIEVRGGFADAYGIEIGQTVDIR